MIYNINLNYSNFTISLGKHPTTKLHVQVYIIDINDTIMPYSYYISDYTTLKHFYQHLEKDIEYYTHWNIKNKKINIDKIKQLVKMFLDDILDEELKDILTI